MSAVLGAVTIASLTRLAQPIIKDLYDKSKKLGVRGLQKWEMASAAGKIARRIKKIDEVKTLWKSSQATSIREFIHPPRVLIDGQSRIVTRLEDVPYKNVIIEGIVGQGKSIFLRSVAVGELLSNDAKVIPVFIEMRSLTGKTNLQKTILSIFESYDVDIESETVDYLYGSGRICILLDGFDEVDEALVGDVYRDIDFLATRYPDLQIVITSRPDNEIQKNPLFKVCRIAPLTQAEYPSFLDKLGVKTEKSQAIRQAIKLSPSKISSLITTPLMLTLVVLVYETESRIPESLPEFFERLFQVVFSRHDHLKDNFSRKLSSDLSERRLQLLFEAFCCMCMQLGYKSAMTNEQFHEAYTQAIAYMDDFSCEADHFKEDIVSVTCLMLEDGFDSVAFLHNSILEYFAASFIKRLDDESAKNFYQEAALRSHEWEESLYFLKSIDTYRYHRDYALPSVAVNMQEVVLNLNDVDDKKFVGALVKIMGGITINYAFSQESDSELRISSLSWSKTFLGDNIGGFQGLLARSIFLQLPNTISKVEYIEKFGPVDVNGIGPGVRVSMTLPQMTNVYGVDELRSCVGIYTTRLESAQKEAEKVIDSQKKKKLIFVKKPKHNQ